jgi:hypothetical protein
MKPSLVELFARLAPGRPIVGLAVAVIAWATVPTAIAFGAGPKYYFQIQEVKAGPEVDAALKAYAAEALKADLASRPEWASDIGQTARPGEDRTGLVSELKKRSLRGFDVTVRFDEFKQELKDPKPGGKLKQLAVNVRLSVFGTTIPEAKVAFGGTGEAGVEAEVSERRMAADSASAGRDVVKDAIKQAVDQAVLKLSGPKSQPMTERRRKK